MTFDGRDFHVRARPDEKDRDEWYKGYILIRTDVEPTQIGFVVLVQSGEPGHRISKGIFYFDGETVIIKAPEHGLPRPRVFESSTGPIALLRLRRDPDTRINTSANSLRLLSQGEQPLPVHRSVADRF